MNRIAVVTFVGLLLFTGSHVLSGQELPPASNRPIDFQRDIQPLLQKHCVSCHGREKQESGLRLDRREAMLQGGDLGVVVSLGKSDGSRLIHYVAGTNPDSVMPPKGDRLTAEDIGLLRAWIDQGAGWSEAVNSSSVKNTHWAYQPIRKPVPPDVRSTAWPINDIDRFVLENLERHNVPPSGEANRFTLIRRLSLDLTGLPPTVEDVDAFVNDQHLNAYESLVDRLLASPHFGERWGRHWLDMARYADSDGYEKDNPRPDAWRWRDWVIDAINSDMPFDQFTIEQIAGDLLPDATPMQRLATAFHRQTLTNTEGGTDQEQFRVEACFDRTETTGTVWLGLTVGCARCHTHKYDAITQREYYQLFSVLNNGDESTVVVPKSDSEVGEYAVAKATYDAEIARLTAKLKVAQEQKSDAYIVWQDATKALTIEATNDPVELHGLTRPGFSGDSGITFTPQKGGIVLVGGANPDRTIYTVLGRTNVHGITGLRLDVLPDNSLPSRGPGRVAHGNFVLSELTMEVASIADFSDAQKVEFAAAKADFEQADRPWAANNTIDGKDDTGWAISPQIGKKHWLVLRLKDSLTAMQPTYLRIRLSHQYGQQHSIGRFKLSLQTGVDPNVSIPENILQALNQPAAQRTNEQKQQLHDYFSRLQSPTKELISKLDELKKKDPAKPEVTSRVIVQRIKDPRTTYVLKRGEFLDPIRDLEVRPAAFSTLPAMIAREESGISDRLDLARWLVSPENPLSPRVTANHVWRLLFGHGIVRSSNDFGVRGEEPTHPELMDWLAADLLSGSGSGRPWSRKALIRRIVMSATYRQTSMHRRELADTDPQNLWLARQNRLRVEAEVVRDISLDVSGLLSTKIGGPGVFPPLPPGIAELSYAGNFKWEESTGENRYRRGMYTFFKRTSPHPNLIAFDCPDANLTCIERQTSNTPLQALTSLNNETFAETSRAFAKRLLQQSESNDAARLATAFRICLARPGSARELEELHALLNDAQSWYLAHPVQAVQLTGKEIVSETPIENNAAWVAVARVLLNLDEFITRE